MVGDDKVPRKRRSSNSIVDYLSPRQAPQHKLSRSSPASVSMNSGSGKREAFREGERAGVNGKAAAPCAAGGGGGARHGQQRRAAASASSSSSSAAAAAAAATSQHASAPSAASAATLPQQQQQQPRRHGASNPKKLVIKPFARAPQLPEEFYRQNWEQQLRSAVRAVHANSGTGFSLEELYRKVEDICLHKLAPKLYGDLHREVDAHLHRVFETLDTRTNDDVLRAWDEHCSHTRTLRAIFLYLDRTYAVETSNVLPLWDDAMELFGSHMVRQRDGGDNRALLQTTIDNALDTIERERCGETVDRSRLRKLLVDMLTSLRRYYVFETRFLSKTRRFYAAEGAELVRACDMPKYLAHCETRLAEERDRVKAYLEASTQRSLLGIVEQWLFRECIDAMLDKGFASLLDEMRMDDLRLLYRLLRETKERERIVPRFAEYVKNRATAIVMQQEGGDMVKELLELHRRVESVRHDAFGDDSATHNASQRSFETAINARHNVPAEQIAKYMDSVLKRGNKRFTDEELNDTLARVMGLFRHINGKDVFEAFYKKELAKRLLLGRSASLDLERAVVARLRTECGAAFTNHLEGMFKDVDVSADLMQSFARHRHRYRLSSDAMEFSAHVLTVAYWPLGAPSQLRLPPEMRGFQDAFQRYYLGKHSGRRLSWHSAMSTCVLRARFPSSSSSSSSGGEKMLSVSLHQALVLLLFNEADRLSLEEIAQGVGGNEAEADELRRTLQSLACGKVRVLQKEPRGRDVNDGDVFCFNADFSDKHMRIKINQIQAAETRKEHEHTTERVFQDRQYQIDAAIVRVMKTRRTVQHTQLIAELYEQLKFPHRPADLKKRIESLIEREYMQRSAHDSQTYEYIA